MQAADFLDDPSTVEKLCQYAGTWLFERHTENTQHDKEHQQQKVGSPRISEERLQVRFKSPWVGELHRSHDHLSLQAAVILYVVVLLVRTVQWCAMQRGCASRCDLE